MKIKNVNYGNVATFSLIKNVHQRSKHLTENLKPDYQKQNDMLVCLHNQRKK